MRMFLPFLAGMIVASCTPSRVVSPPVDQRPVTAPKSVENPPQPSPAPEQPVKPKTVGEIERELGLPAGTIRRQRDEFTLGIGDSVTLTFRSHERFNQTASVLPDGTMNLIGLGAITAVGRTLKEIHAEVVRKTVSSGLRNPVVDVDLKAIADKYVTMIGYSTKSGRIKISGNGTILETLFAGGYNPAQTKTHRVALIRRSRCSIIDLREIIGLNNIDINVKLEAEDILMFLERGVFAVRGEVENGGSMPIPERGYVTLDEAIVLAGGVKKTANVGDVQILRSDGKIEKTDLNAYLYRREPGTEILIRPGDEVLFRPTRDIGVYVLGMVNKPGLHHRGGSITVSQALALADHTKFGAVIEDARLVRGYPDHPQVVGVNFNALFNGDMTQDVAMQEGDVLVVPESALSDVFDFTTRLLAPLSGVTRSAVDVLTAKELSNK